MCGTGDSSSDSRSRAAEFPEMLSFENLFNFVAVLKRMCLQTYIPISASGWLEDFFEIGVICCVPIS
jgi:hypothetical protein